MADVTLNILEPATEFDLITIEEAKIGLGLSLITVDPVLDQQLAFLISVQSSVVSGMCNRVFARETLTESWREIETDNRGHRLFLSHWPTKSADIDSVTSNGTTLIPTLGNWKRALANCHSIPASTSQRLSLTPAALIFQMRRRWRSSKRRYR